MASRAVNSDCEAQKKVSDSKKVGDIFITLHCYLTKLEEMCVIIYRGEYRLFAENYITFFIKFRKKIITEMSAYIVIVDFVVIA